jgi:hypothetical protein
MYRTLFVALIAVIAVGVSCTPSPAACCLKEGCWQEMPSPTKLVYHPCQQGCLPYQGPIAAPRFHIPLPDCGCGQVPCVIPCQKSRCRHGHK